MSAPTGSVIGLADADRTDFPILAAFLEHNSGFHTDFRAEEVRSALIEWYATNRRRLPWRGDAPPYNGSTAGTNKAETQPALGSQLQAFGVSTLTSARAATAAAVIAGKPAFEVTPYGVWVSEIMCQQTRVEAVVPYWLAWMEAFPTVEALAAASESQVNAQWAGLGFYRRAAMLHAAARQVVDKHGGQIPRTVDGLMGLSGVGRYTAGAIASICFDVAAPVVDGNVLRMLSRLRGVAASPKRPAYCDKLAWALAERLVVAGGGERPGDLNQAIMELGATYCAPDGTGRDSRDPLRGMYLSTAIGADAARAQAARRLAPMLAAARGSAGRGVLGCGVCGEGAAAFLDGVEEAAVAAVSKHGLRGASEAAADACATAVHKLLPLPAPKKARREERLAVLALHRCAGDAITSASWLLVRRPDGGLLSGQWELPSAPVASHKSELTADPGDQARSAAIDAALSVLGIGTSELSARRRIDRPVEHIFSHVRHTMHIETASVRGQGGGSGGAGGSGIWGSREGVRGGGGGKGGARGGGTDEGSALGGAAVLTLEDGVHWTTADGTVVCWMCSRHMAEVGVTAGVKKVLSAVEDKSGGRAAQPSARGKQGAGKRKAEGASADQQLRAQPMLSAFFSQTN